MTSCPESELPRGVLARRVAHLRCRRREHDRLLRHGPYTQPSSMICSTPNCLLSRVDAKPERTRPTGRIRAVARSGRRGSSGFPFPARTAAVPSAAGASGAGASAGRRRRRAKRARRAAARSWRAARAPTRAGGGAPPPAARARGGVAPGWPCALSGVLRILAAFVRMYSSTSSPISSTPALYAAHPGRAALRARVRDHALRARRRERARALGRDAPRASSATPAAALAARGVVAVARAVCARRRRARARVARARAPRARAGSRAPRRAPLATGLRRVVEVLLEAVPPLLDLGLVPPEVVRERREPARRRGRVPQPVGDARVHRRRVRQPVLALGVEVGEHRRCHARCWPRARARARHGRCTRGGALAARAASRARRRAPRSRPSAPCAPRGARPWREHARALVALGRLRRSARARCSRLVRDAHADELVAVDAPLAAPSSPRAARARPRSSDATPSRRPTRSRLLVLGEQERQWQTSRAISSFDAAGSNRPLAVDGEIPRLSHGRRPRRPRRRGERP